MMHRRSFLKFVAGSPLLAAHPALTQSILSKPEQALSVADFEAAAEKALPLAHWGYMATGVDDDATLRANRQAFARYQLRPRRLVDVSRVEIKTELLGRPLEDRIIIAPVGAQKMYHREGEIATARAARSRNSLLILSTATTVPLEEVA